MFPIVQAEQWDTQWFQPSAIKELHSEEPKRVYNLINDTFFFPLHPPLKHPPLFEHMWSPSGQDSFALNLALWRERKCIWSNPQRDVLKWKRRRPNREVRKVFRDFCLSVQNRKSLPHNALKHGKSICPSCKLWCFPCFLTAASPLCSRPQSPLLELWLIFPLLSLITILLYVPTDSATFPQAACNFSWLWDLLSTQCGDFLTLSPATTLLCSVHADFQISETGSWAAPNDWREQHDPKQWELSLNMQKE